MLGELCALTGWHRDYARRALRQVAARRPEGTECGYFHKPYISTRISKRLGEQSPLALIAMQ